MDQQYLGKDAIAACCCCDAHTTNLSVGWLASRSTGLACINTSAHLTNHGTENVCRDETMNAPKISQRTFTLSRRLNMQDLCSQVVGPTMCIRFLSFWCMCIAHLNESFQLGIIFSRPAVGSILKERRRIGKARPQ